MSEITRREFMRLGGAGAIALNGSVLLAGCSTMAAVPTYPAFDPAIHVDPELRSRVPMMQMIAAHPLSADTLERSRKGYFVFPPLPEPHWAERMIAGPGGAASLRIYVINATAADRARPAILHTHGGGFVVGTAKGSLRSLQELALALECVIVTVDYRLAPETPFPGALEDNYAALKWLYANAAELGVDRARIAVMGESAGGGHAAMLAIAARDRGEVPLVFQALIYPMLDDRTGSRREVPAHIGTLLWTRESNRFGWSSLLGVPAGSREVPHGAVPARAEHLGKLPPAFIGVGSIDLFVQEDIAYASRLIEAGVPTELFVAAGAYHGFFEAVPKAGVSVRFKAAYSSALAQAFQSHA
jgi:acetyl esterase/lipase